MRGKEGKCRKRNRNIISYTFPCSMGWVIEKEVSVVAGDEFTSFSCSFDVL